MWINTHLLIMQICLIVFVLALAVLALASLALAVWLWKFIEPCERITFIVKQNDPESI
jgi:hypothetical protein